MIGALFFTATNGGLLMKAKLTRAAAVLLLLATVIGLLPVFGSQTLVYSTQSNSGIRDVICTTLDGTSADDYYGTDYDYDYLSTLSSTALFNELAKLMTDTHKKITTYNDCRDKVFFVDCENNNTGNATTLYTSFSMSSSHWKGVWSCNREHVWPQSLGGNNTSGGGADLHHIRPSENLINSTSGNMLYGNV